MLVGLDDLIINGMEPATLSVEKLRSGLSGEDRRMVQQTCGGLQFHIHPGLETAAHQNTKFNMPKANQAFICYNYEKMNSVQKLKPKFWSCSASCRLGILEAAFRQGNVIGSLGIELGSLGLAKVFNFWVAWLVPWCGTCMDIFANRDTSIYVYIYIYTCRFSWSHVRLPCLHSNEFVAILTPISTSKMVQFPSPVAIEAQDFPRLYCWVLNEVIGGKGGWGRRHQAPLAALRAAKCFLPLLLLHSHVLLKPVHSKISIARWEQTGPPQQEVGNCSFFTCTFFQYVKLRSNHHRLRAYGDGGVGEAQSLEGWNALEWLRQKTGYKYTSWVLMGSCMIVSLLLGVCMFEHVS